MSAGEWFIKNQDTGIKERLEEIRNNETKRMFTYHPVKPGQAEKYTAIRAKGLELANLINELCPMSDETRTAITKLREVVMWANGAIAVHDEGKNE